MLSGPGRMSHEDPRTQGENLSFNHKSYLWFSGGWRGPSEDWHHGGKSQRRHGEIQMSMFSRWDFDQKLFWVLRTLSWLRLLASWKPPRGLCKIEITIFLTLFFSGSLWSWSYGRAWSWPPGKIYFFVIIWIRAKLFENGILASASAYTTFSYFVSLWEADYFNFFEF